MQFDDIPTDIWTLFSHYLKTHQIHRLSLACSAALRTVTHLRKSIVYNTKYMPLECIDVRQYSNLERVEIPLRRNVPVSFHLFTGAVVRALASLPKLRHLTCTFVMLFIDVDASVSFPRLETLIINAIVPNGFQMPDYWRAGEWEPTELEPRQRLYEDKEWHQCLPLPTMPRLSHLALSRSFELKTIPTLEKTPSHLFNLREALGKLTTLHGITINSYGSAGALAFLTSIQSLKFAVNLPVVEELAIISRISAYLSNMTTLTDLHLPIFLPQYLIQHQFTRLESIKALYRPISSRPVIQTTDALTTIIQHVNFSRVATVKGNELAKMTALTVLNLHELLDPAPPIKFSPVFPVLRKLHVPQLINWFDRPVEQLTALRTLHGPLTTTTLRLVTALPEFDSLTLDCFVSGSPPISFAETFKYPVIHRLRILRYSLQTTVVKSIFERRIFNKTAQLIISFGEVGDSAMRDLQIFLRNAPCLQHVFITITSQRYTAWNIGTLHPTLAHHHNISLLAINDGNRTHMWPKRIREKLITLAPSRVFVWSRGIRISTQYNVPFVADEKIINQFKRPLIGSKKWHYIPLPAFILDPNVHPLQPIAWNDHTSWVWGEEAK